MPNFLTEKIGPLPTWGWMALATVAVGGYIVYSRHQQSSQQQVQQAAQMAAMQAAATQTASQYQPYTVPYVSSQQSYSGGTYGNGYAGPRRRPHHHDQPADGTAAAMAVAPAGPGWGPDTPDEPAAPSGGTRHLGRGAKIVGRPGRYGLVNDGTYNSFGSGITSLSQADSYAKQFGAP